MERSSCVWLSVVFLLLVLLLEAWVLTMETNRRIKALKIHVLTLQELAISLMAWYIWKRVTYIFKSGNNFSYSSVIRLAFFVLLSFAQLCIVVAIFFVSQEPSWIASVSNTCLGVALFLFLSLAIIDFTSYVLRRIFCSESQWTVGGFNRTEIRFRSFLALLVAVILSLTGFIGMSRFAVERLVIPVKGLDPRLNGTTLVQMSDLHLGPYIGRSALQRVLSEVNALEADLVVITGDLVDESVASLRGAVEPLKNIHSRLGVFFCTGNHEYYTGDVDGWVAELPRLDVTPLINSRVCVMPSGPRRGSLNCTGGVYLAGVEDIETELGIYGAHSMDLPAALSGRTEGVPTLVLAHQPKAAVQAVKWHDVRLVLSGHTHAGQIFPWMLFVYLTNPLFVGLYEPSPGVFVYVSPGTLFYVLPFRHFRPEITHFTLVSA